MEDGMDCLIRLRKYKKMLKSRAYDILEESKVNKKEIHKLSDKQSCLEKDEHCEQYTIFVTDDEWNAIMKYKKHCDDDYDKCTSNIPGCGPCKCCGGFVRLD
jgi:hypothetical protein